MMTAIACSLSDDDDPTVTTATVTVGGSVDQSGSSKPRAAVTSSANLTVVVVYPDQGTAGTGTITGTTTLTYEADVVQGKNCFIEIRLAGSSNVYMSRFLSSEDTDVDISAPIDALSTYISSKVKAAITAGETNYTEAYDSVLTAIFGSSVPSNLFLSFSSLRASITDASILDAIDSIADAILAFDIANPDAYFDILNAIETDGQGTVTFGSSPVSAQEKAAPGFVYGFKITAPEGILSTSTPYSMSISPAFAGDYSIDGTNAVAKIIPDAADVGTTFTITITANGALGATDSFTTDIEVGALKITGQGLLALKGSLDATSYQLEAGPEVSGDSFFVIAQKDGAHTIERYSVSSLSSFGSNATIGFPTDGLAYTAIIPHDYSDALVYGSYVYVTDASSGTIKYDFSLAGVSTSQVIAPSTFTATELAKAGTKILAFNYETQALRAIDTSDDEDSSTGITFEDGFTAFEVGSLGDYFYVGGTASGNNVYQFYTQNFVQTVGAFTTPYDYEFVADQFSSTKAYGLASNTDVLVLSMTSASVGPVVTYNTSSLAGAVYANNPVANGSTVYAPQVSTSTILSYSLSSSDNITSTEGNEVSGMTTAISGDIANLVINLPEGADSDSTTIHNTGSFLIPVYTSQNTNVWYLKAFELSAE